MPSHRPPHSLPHTNTHTTVRPSRNRLQCIHSGETDAKPSIVSCRPPSLKVYNPIKSGVGVWGGGFITHGKSAVPVFQLHVLLLSCIWGVKRSRGQQRQDGSLNLTQVIGALLEIGEKACVRGFSTTSPALSSVLCYRFIPCAAEYCEKYHIKVQA